mgnify:CR=1 FL=1
MAKRKEVTIERERQFIEPFLVRIEWLRSRFDGRNLQQFLQEAQGERKAWDPATQDRAANAIRRFGRYYVQGANLEYHKQLRPKDWQEQKRAEPFTEALWLQVRRGLEKKRD